MASICEQIFANRTSCQRALIEWYSFDGKQTHQYYSAAWLQSTSSATAAKINAGIISSAQRSITVVILTHSETASVAVIVSMLAAMRLGFPFLFVHDDVDDVFGQRWHCQVVLDCSNCSTLHTNIPRIKFVTWKSLDSQEIIESSSEQLRLKDDILYYLSTSGSTGEPRWVAGTVEGTRNRILWQLQQQQVPTQPTDVHIAKTALRFVDSIAELLVPLTVGSPLIVAHPPTETSPKGNGWSNPFRDPGILLRVCREWKVTHLVATPTVLNELIRPNTLSLRDTSLRSIHSSGEALSTSLTRHLLEKAPPRMVLWNLYGSTEVSADVAARVCRVNGDDSGASFYQAIGGPLPNCCLYLLEEDGRGTWAQSNQGEIFVTGRHVAAGYVNTNSESHAFGWLHQRDENGKKYYYWSTEQIQDDSEWCFRTGDIGCWNTHHELSILGRSDQVMKINGIKVSLLQVEATLRECGVHGAATVLKHFDHPWLIALSVQESTMGACPSCLQVEKCVGADDGGDHVIWSCRDCESLLYHRLEKRLPNKNAVPRQIIFATELPRSRSGKIDRERIREILSDACQRSRPIQRGIDHRAADKLVLSQPTHREVWLDWFMRQASLLLAIPINEDDNLLFCGGDSITLIQLAARTRNLLGRVSCNDCREFNLLSMFERNPTPSLLTKVVLSMLTRDSAMPALEARIKVCRLRQSDLREATSVVAEAFCSHEPLTKALLRSPARVERYRAQMRNIWRRLLKDELCFVVKETGESAIEQIVGFALAAFVKHYPSSSAPGDRCHPICAICVSSVFHPFSMLNGVGIQLPELKSLEKFYSEIMYRWAEWYDLDLANGGVVQISMSGSKQGTPGSMTNVSRCESSILKTAKEKGARLVFTICTHAATKAIAREIGMRSRMKYNTRAILRDLKVQEQVLDRIPNDHQVELFDYNCEENHRFDSMEDCCRLEQRYKLELLSLTSQPDTTAKVEELVNLAFRYFRRADIRRELSHLSERKGKAFVLRKVTSQEIVACCVFDTHESINGDQIVGELFLLAVRPKYRGLGASRRLLTELIALGHKENWRSVFLVARNRVQHIYGSRGFRKADDTDLVFIESLAGTEIAGRDKSVRLLVLHMGSHF